MPNNFSSQVSLVLDLTGTGMVKKVERHYSNSDQIKAVIEKRFQGDAIFYKVIVDVFLDTTRKNLKIIRQSLKSNDFEKIKFSAHSIKGSAVNIGAEEIYEIAEEIESMGKNQNSTQIERSIELIEKELVLLNEFVFVSMD